jgi:hypothetical protein
VSELLDLGKNSPIYTVLRRTLEGIKSPVSIEELCINALETWARSFAQTPYENACIVYKLIGTYLECEYHYGEIGGPPLIPLAPGSEDLIPLRPEQPLSELCKHVDIIKKIKVTLRKN